MKKACQSCPYFSLGKQQELLEKINSQMEGILKLTWVISDNKLNNSKETEVKTK